jgi:hypothetical protein
MKAMRSLLEEDCEDVGEEDGEDSVIPGSVYYEGKRAF